MNDFETFVTTELWTTYLHACESEGIKPEPLDVLMEAAKLNAHNFFRLMQNRVPGQLPYVAMNVDDCLAVICQLVSDEIDDNSQKVSVGIVPIDTLKGCITHNRGTDNVNTSDREDIADESSDGHQGTEVPEHDV